MNSREVYKRFLLKVNRNDSNEGVKILPSHFVLMFNNETFRWLAESLNKGDDSNLSRLDRLLEPNVELTFNKRYDDSEEYNLPENFYRHASSFSIVEAGKCSDIKIFNFEKKPLGFTATLADDFSSPQLDFEETPFIITDNKMRIFREGFKIKKVFATYYKTPTPIDIGGYIKLDGTPSTDVHSNLHDDNIDEILNRVALEVLRQYQDGESFNYRKDAVATEE